MGRLTQDRTATEWHSGAGLLRGVRVQLGGGRLAFSDGGGCGEAAELDKGDIHSSRLALRLALGKPSASFSLLGCRW